VKKFITNEKSSGKFVESMDGLLKLYLESENNMKLSEEVFENCLQRMATIGLITNLSIGRKGLA